MNVNTIPPWATAAREALTDEKSADLQEQYEGQRRDEVALAELFQRLGLPLDVTGHPLYTHETYCALVPKCDGCPRYRPIYVFYAVVDERQRPAVGRRLLCIKSCSLVGQETRSRSRYIDCAADLGRLLNECPRW